MIEDQKKDIFKLENEISKYKMNEERLNEEVKQLKSVIKEMREEIESLNDQKVLLS